MPAKPRRATLAMIAESAGVSVATVSKVLNGRSDVSPSTRSRVQSLLRQHHYVASAPRRQDGLDAGTSVQVEFDDHLTAYSAEIIQGAVLAGEDLGVSVVVGMRASDRAATWVRDLVGSGRQALVAVTSELTREQLDTLAGADLPLVVIDPLNLPRARIPSVGSTNFAGGLTATQHLLDLGHRRIAFLAGAPGAACNQARMHGYRAAMEAAGAPVPPDYIQPANFDFPHGIEAATTLLALPCPPTAVFAANDESALGAIEAARTHGLRIPQDLSVVGFDGTQLSRMATPPLTTVRQPLSEMGAVALRTALRLAAGHPIDSYHVELATELVVRSSTAPPPPK
jgi:LacI family transcriptional regulator